MWAVRSIGEGTRQRPAALSRGRALSHGDCRRRGHLLGPAAAPPRVSTGCSRTRGTSRSLPEGQDALALGALHLERRLRHARRVCVGSAGIGWPTLFGSSMVLRSASPSSSACRPYLLLRLQVAAERRREAVGERHDAPVLRRHREARADALELLHRHLEAAVAAQPQRQDAADRLEVRVGDVAALAELREDLALAARASGRPRPSRACCRTASSGGCAGSGMISGSLIGLQVSAPRSLTVTRRRRDRRVSARRGAARVAPSCSSSSP